MSSDHRYVFCAVSLDGGPEEYRTIGLEGNQAYLVREGNVGALVQDQQSTFESTESMDMQRLLVDHLTIVDEVGDSFGTPLPLRFNTVFEGGDEGVRKWLRNEQDSIQTQLERVAGHWEYRIEVIWTTERPAENADDDRLAELESKLEDAGPGKRFLLEKQYDQRVAELTRKRKATEQQSLESRVQPFAKELASLEDQSLQLGGQTDDGDVVARVSVLTTNDGARAIGDELDHVAAEDGVKVRYTGPWPPYTHVSEGVSE